MPGTLPSTFDGAPKAMDCPKAWRETGATENN